VLDDGESAAGVDTRELEVHGDGAQVSGAVEGTSA
jgi:hypothetical protein